MVNNRVVNPDGTVITMDEHKSNVETQDGGIQEKIDLSEKKANLSALKELESDPKAYALYMNMKGEMSPSQFLAGRKTALDKNKKTVEATAKLEKETAQKYPNNTGATQGYARGDR